MATLGDVRRNRTPQDAAQWMFDEVMRKGSLEHAAAVEGIKTNFGKHLLNDAETSICQEVREAFWALAGDAIVWDNVYRLYRKRQPGDPPGGMQY